MSGPRNRSTRAQRIEQWNAAVSEGRSYQPRKADGKHARYDWLRTVMASDLPNITRLVSHTMAFHGRADGSGIFPSVRLIAKEAGLSERAVCTHIDLLVRRGFLWRKSRVAETTAGALGFVYILAIPSVLNEIQHCAGNGAERGSTLRAVLNAVQHRVDPDATSAERRSI